MTQISIQYIYIPEKELFHFVQYTDWCLPSKNACEDQELLLGSFKNLISWHNE